ncbi:hypothetical protein C8J56DRAFT_890957 [Mycena floridula]|nr:hypothetical protein C8J56DRAFT_890957 [Mycena floridula]
MGRPCKYETADKRLEADRLRKRRYYEQHASGIDPGLSTTRRSSAAESSAAKHIVPAEDIFIEQDMVVFMRMVVGTCLNRPDHAQGYIDEMIRRVDSAGQYASRLEVDLWEKSGGPEHEHAKLTGQLCSRLNAFLLDVACECYEGAEKLEKSIKYVWHVQYLNMEVLSYLDIRGDSLLEDDFMARINVGFWSHWPEPRGDLTLEQFRERIKDREKILLQAMEALALQRIQWRQKHGFDADGVPLEDAHWKEIKRRRERCIRPRPKPYDRRRAPEVHDYSSNAEGSKCVPFETPVTYDGLNLPEL